MQAYFSAIQKVELYGGTCFNEIIRMVNGHAKQAQEEMSQANQKYTVLLIITDGIINDMQQTINEVVNGSGLPLSIIIVGVGEAEFDQMETLDADEAPL
jgi:vacuolar-type H+-ATPase subunit F/Vma7